AMMRMTEFDLGALTNRDFFPSPAAWEDQVLYFLPVDRFSDGHETSYRDVAGNIGTTSATPPFRVKDAGNAAQTVADAERWRELGGRFVAGTLAGLQSSTEGA